MTQINLPPAGASAPVQGNERMHILDILRGFALFGILMMNIEYFQRPMQAVMLGLDQTQTGINYAVGWFVFVFIQGKFYTLFSLLFGIGFVVFLDRARARVSRPRWLFSRRLLILVLIGALHGFFIWSGDILLLYALTGFLLLLFFHKTSASRLWKWAIVFLVIPLIMFWLGAWSIEMAMQSNPKNVMAMFTEQQEALLGDIARGELIYMQGSYWEAVQWRMHEMIALYGGGGLLFFGMSVLALFALGASCARAGIFQDVAGNISLFKRLVFLGYGIGIPAALIFGIWGTDLVLFYPNYDAAVFYVFQQLANIALCFAYLSTLVLLMHYGKRWVRVFAPAGQMALTNYLLQSIVFTLIFYGYGLGLYGEVGRAGATFMAIIFYVGQLFASQWWLERYRYGPAEWLWRSLTYGQRQPFKKAM
ncbi:DUF418 domain-containing protein [Aliidiomarina sanyensis]|uniref:DUF418 domain-containing protein n=1 Tax=Aliidiomarina sanyensis TaxID=1249555 RepID=A0A432WPK1_9GAMM|nr:DUF418 domain-containing protein [Aliidiomarina sanyensis]RUO35668.1 hypothetical protein CWE11_02600 [Aliidiomarina sanyensis]